MSHHHEPFSSAPEKLIFSQEKLYDFNKIIKLIVKGQGTFAFKSSQAAPFEIFISFDNLQKDGLQLEVNTKNTSLYLLKNNQKIHLKSTSNCTIDAEPDALYWVSLNHLEQVLKVGIGEVRDILTCFECPLSSNGITPTDLRQIDHFKVSSSVIPVINYRDPVVLDPALKIISTDQITIEDIAHNNYVIPINLTKSCQKLYSNISGRNFALNTSDFPDFVDAIEGSIACKSGWCYKKLQEKATEFGERNDKETYLRITLGSNQGESPGIPYVIEIWPPGNYSPIHNHGGANAIIRVLHGEIKVNLYPMLSTKHQDCFKSAIFRQDEITWISARYNQFHQLHNVNETGPTCITIQCYLYDQKDIQHYEYFDYISSNDSIEHFTPNSDADYLDFKKIIKEEWPTIQKKLAKQN